MPSSKLPRSSGKHVWTPIVEGKHATVIVHEENGAMAAAHDTPTHRLQFLDGACAHKI
jgi:hypothetical protein